jgi:hypothetical protein
MTAHRAYAITRHGIEPSNQRSNIPLPCCEARMRPPQSRTESEVSSPAAVAVLNSRQERTAGSTSHFGSSFTSAGPARNGREFPRGDMPDPLFQPGPNIPVSAAVRERWRPARKRVSDRALTAGGWCDSAQPFYYGGRLGPCAQGFPCRSAYHSAADDYNRKSHSRASRNKSEAIDWQGMPIGVSERPRERSSESTTKWKGGRVLSERQRDAQQRHQEQTPTSARPSPTIPACP